MSLRFVGWSRAVLAITDWNYEVRAVTRSVGRALSGRAQVVAPGVQVGVLTITLGEVSVPDLVRAREVLLMSLAGRANIAMIPLCDPYGASGSTAALFSDGTRYTDGTSFDDHGGPYALSQAAAVGDEVLVIDHSGAPAQIAVGQMFSHDGHLYRVHATASGARVWVMPRIRRAIPVGTDLLTDPPIFFGRLTEDSAGQVQRELGRFSGAVTLTLEEAWER